jgi:hypothetical protein
MSLFDSVAALPLEIEGVELERRELPFSKEFTRVTTTVTLRGGGEAGSGEDVTYQSQLHDGYPEPDVRALPRVSVYAV